MTRGALTSLRSIHTRLQEGSQVVRPQQVQACVGDGGEGVGAHDRAVRSDDRHLVGGQSEHVWVGEGERAERVDFDEAEAGRVVDAERLQVHVADVCRHTQKFKLSIT